MFQSKERYITRGVFTEVPVIIQNFLWYLIDEEAANGKKVDYFQIFELEVVEGGQKITHKQEHPSRSKEIILPLAKENQLNKKI